MLKNVLNVSVKSVGDKSELGTTESQKLKNCKPYGVCVNNQNNLVAADVNGKCLHIYNNLGQDMCIVRLPSGVSPMYLSAHPSGSYVITNTSAQITWVYEEGREKKRHQDTACGITLSSVSGIVRDIDNKYIVADHGNNQQLFFSQNGEYVRCLMKGISEPFGLFFDHQQHKLDAGTENGQINTIRKPFSLFLDHQQNKLYVVTGHGEVVVYDYYMLLRKNIPWSTPWLLE